MKIVFKAIPGVVLQTCMPDADGKAVPFSQMKVGSDGVLLLEEGSSLAVEVEEGLSDLEAVAVAYEKLLDRVAEATLRAFMKARQRIIEEQQSQIQL